MLFHSVDEQILMRLNLEMCPTNPRHSMYAIYAYIDPQKHPNVGIYGIHGVSN